MPGIGDIKDGLLKMMLYTNLENVSIEDKPLKSLPLLQLSSENIAGQITSDSELEIQESFFRANNFNRRQKELVRNLFAEAIENNFAVKLGKIYK